MQASSIGVSRVIQAAADTTVGEAARAMQRQQVGCIVVVEQNLDGVIPVGIVTDRDLVTAVLAEKHERSITLGAVMSSPLATCREDASLTDVIAILWGSGVRRLPLVDAHGRLTGIISSEDVLSALTMLLESLTGVFAGDPTQAPRRA